MGMFVCNTGYSLHADRYFMQMKHPAILCTVQLVPIHIHIHTHTHKHKHAHNNNSNTHAHTHPIADNNHDNTEQHMDANDPPTPPEMQAPPEYPTNNTNTHTDTHTHTHTHTHTGSLQEFRLNPHAKLLLPNIVLATRYVRGRRDIVVMFDEVSCINRRRTEIET